MIELHFSPPFPDKSNPVGPRQVVLCCSVPFFQNTFLQATDLSWCWPQWCTRSSLSYHFLSHLCHREQQELRSWLRAQQIKFRSTARFSQPKKRFPCNKHTLNRFLLTSFLHVKSVFVQPGVKHRSIRYLRHKSGQYKGGGGRCKT